MKPCGDKDSRSAHYIPAVRLPLLLLILALPLAAQSSPYVPLDHPLLPAAEFLIARGDIDDPSPMIRPFRRSDLLRVLGHAELDPNTPSGRVAAELVKAFTEPPGDHWIRVSPRLGVDGFSRARRDLFHPAGDGGVRPYLESSFELRSGPLVLMSRAAAENRLKLDPDWPGTTFQNTKSQAYRFIDAYIAGQWKHGRLFFGQMDRNWGPPGSAGLSIANQGYPRTDLAFDIVFRDLMFSAVATQLTEMKSTDGSVHKRYFAAHRLNVRLTHRLNIALWETAVLTGPNRSFQQGLANTMILFSFPAQQGMADDRNTILGGDLTWRPAQRLLLQGQAMVDDMWRRKADPNGTGEPVHPGRWAATMVGSGALGNRLSWRAHLAVVNALAYRTVDSAKNFVDRGLGIGPQFPDNLSLGLGVGVPVGKSWLVTPDLTLFKQGEGRLDQPFPLGASLTATPELFQGTVESTWRLGARVSGGLGAFQLLGDGGWHHVTNLNHIVGASRSRFEARLRATIGFTGHRAIQ